MALHPCVLDILCPLGDEVIAALDVVAQLLDQNLNSQIAAIEAQLALIAVPVQAAEIAANAAQAVIDQAKSVASLIPLSTDCVDLGDIGVNISASIESSLADARDFSNEATQLLAFQDELTAGKDALMALKVQYEEFRDELKGCGGRQ